MQNSMKSNQQENINKKILDKQYQVQYQLTNIANEEKPYLLQEIVQKLIEKVRTKAIFQEPKDDIVNIKQFNKKQPKNQTVLNTINNSFQLEQKFKRLDNKFQQIRDQFLLKEKDLQKKSFDFQKVNSHDCLDKVIKRQEMQFENQNRKFKILTVYKFDDIESKNVLNCKKSQILQSENLKQKYQRYYIGPILFSFLKQKQYTYFQQICLHHLKQTALMFNSTFYRQLQVVEKQIARPLSLNNKITLVFDLDETLIHCVRNLTKFEFELTIGLPNNVVTKMGFNIRPYCLQTLRQLKKQFQLMIFTASNQFYANSIIDNILDPKGELFSQRYFRQDCTVTKNGIYLKDLRVIDRDIKKILLIDNSPYSYSLQLDNGIPILPYFQDPQDKQLRSLTHYLQDFTKDLDVRIRNSKYFQFHKYGLKYNSLKDMVTSIYSAT